MDTIKRLQRYRKTKAIRHYFEENKLRSEAVIRAIDIEMRAQNTLDYLILRSDGIVLYVIHGHSHFYMTPPPQKE